MYVYRNVPLQVIWRFGWKNILFFLLYGILICCVHHYLLKYHAFHLHIPFSLIGPVGVAVVIYASFKNSQSYDRTWEARKNWGALAGASRVLADQLFQFVSQTHLPDIRIIVDRQIAYLEAIKWQLRRRSPHSPVYKGVVKTYYHGEPTADDWSRDVWKRMSQAERERVQYTQNRALQIIYLQSRHIQYLQETGMIDQLQQFELMHTLHTCMENQGKNERIKHTPFPRQYAFFSRSFILIYTIILPLGILALYDKYSVLGYAVVIILFTLIAWLYITIELVGHYSEDPFEHFITDIPMSALIRNVEIDLYQLFQFAPVPEKIEARYGVLM